mgnify:CR=1 FL=1
MTTQKPLDEPQPISTKEEVTVRQKVGRPPKTEIKNKTKKNRGKVGRPKGDAGIINEYKARMLASPKSRKVLDTIFNAALDDNHKGQQAAWKLIMDRIAPTAAFEKEIIKENGRSAIQINITGVGSTEVSSGDVIDGEIVNE